MSFKFTTAVREHVYTITGYSGGTGSGKTFSALEYATGLAGGQPFALIDTETGRAKHYADRFRYDHGDLTPPFRPQHYAEAIFAAEEAKYPVIVVDSMSHEWAGEGGILDWQEEELSRMAGNDWQKREACKMASWIKPKMEHKKMVQRLLQLRAHLVLCFRAEEKIEMVRGDDGKMKIQPKVTRTGIDGWVPICEKSLPFELTASFLLTADAPGYPKPIKLQAQHRDFFPLDKPVTRRAGELMAEWAQGKKPEPKVITADESDKLVDAMNEAETTEALQKAFKAAWRRGEAAADEEAKERFKSVYDIRKAGIAEDTAKGGAL